jgi:hypothetical protein
MFAIPALDVPLVQLALEMAGASPQHIVRSVTGSRRRTAAPSCSFVLSLARFTEVSARILALTVDETPADRSGGGLVSQGRVAAGALPGFAGQPW